jgi:hypothetical protein
MRILDAQSQRRASRSLGSLSHRERQRGHAGRSLVYSSTGAMMTARPSTGKRSTSGDGVGTPAATDDVGLVVGSHNRILTVERIPCYLGKTWCAGTQSAHSAKRGPQ